MRKITHAKLRELLARELRLKDPEFRLKNSGTRVNGYVISQTFKGKDDLKRQRMIWDALEREWGDDAIKSIGMLLAYTPLEWEPDFSEPEPTRNGKRLVGK